MAKRRTVESTESMPVELYGSNWAAFLPAGVTVPAGGFRYSADVMVWRRVGNNRAYVAARARLQLERDKVLATLTVRPSGVSAHEFLRAHGLNMTHRGTPAARALGL